MSATVIAYDRRMGRWQPGAPDRLAEAAMALFTERGFDATTVADIAARAGVTERTFFRHYADKREVLFDGQATLAAAFTAAVTDAPADASVAELIDRSLDAGCAVLQQRVVGDWARTRAAVIRDTPALTERELLKMAALAQSLTTAIAARGVDAMHARLAGELAVAVFTTAYEQWVETPDADLAALARSVRAELRAIGA
jgi:AcrR family transcriptional regulator